MGDLMRCLKCGHLDDKVIDSRTSRDGKTIRRRRECLRCTHRFTTYEQVEKENLRVLKRDGRYEELDRHKLLAGIKKACEKRPISSTQIEEVVSEIMTELEDKYDREVPSTVIGEKMMQRLRKLDEVAYVRFASVYRQFRDVNEFVNEIQKLVGK